MTKNLAALFAAVAASALLGACGGGGATVAATPAPTPTPPAPAPGVVRGAYVSSTAPSTITRATIDSFAAAGNAGPLPVGESATCAVTLRRVVYTTILHDGTGINASAGVMVPTGSAACTTGRPLVSYQHGTATSTGFDGSDPSADNVLTMATYYGSHGYVVVIPDYLGYGTTVGNYHPYVMAEDDAAMVIDAVRGARNWLASADGTSTGVTLSGQVVLTGTSEGGYITMATQRTMERDDASEFALAAVVPVSGPYDLITEVRDSLLGPDLPATGGTSNVGGASFLITAYQAVYGDLYTDPAQAFQTPWTTTTVGLLPGRYGSYGSMIQACKLPLQMYTSPAVVESGCNVPANPLLQPQFRTDFLAETPGTTGGTTAAHVRENTLVQGWRNVAPMVPCYGDLDDTAETNALTASTFFATPAIDVQQTQSAVPTFISAWMQAESAVNNDYHGQVEANGCLAYARYSVFDTLITPL